VGGPAGSPLPRLPPAPRLPAILAAGAPEAGPHGYNARVTRRLSALVRLLRPEQWLKNGFVLAPLVFAGRFLDPHAWERAILAATAFCLLASAAYVVNDLVDREADRLHPAKRGRPIASGEVGPAAASALAAACALAGFGLSLALGLRFAAVAGAYLALTLLYSFLFKRAVFLDVLTVAAGFVLRVAGGAEAIAVPVSPWLILCAWLLALYLALGKRRAELVLLGEAAGEHREVLGQYSLPLVDHAIAVVLGATIVAYALYTLAPDTVQKVGSTALIYTVPLVVYGLLRYLYLLHRHELGGSPARTLLTDGPLLLCVALWFVSAGAVLLLS